MRALRRRAVPTALLAALLAAPLVPAPATPTARADAQAGSGRPSAEVVGYLPYWSVDSTTDAGLPYGTLSTIVLFSVGWSTTTGHLSTGASAYGYQMIMSARAATIIAHAHAAGTRVLVCFTSFSTTGNAAFFSNAAAQATFIGEAAALVASVGADGADLDVEGLAGTYFPAYATVAGRLRATLRAANPGASLTVATNANVSGARMAKAAIAAGADRAFLMGYNYRTAGANPVGSIDPYIRADGGLSLTWSLNTYAANSVPLNRVILGLPLYGRSWLTKDGTGLTPQSSPSSTTSVVSSIAGIVASSGATPTHDAGEKTMRLAWQDPTTLQWRQLFWDSPADTGAKTSLVLDRGLAGVGLWALGYDDWAPDWVAAIAATLAPPRLTAASVPAATRTLTVPVTVAVTPGSRAVAGIQLSNDGSHWSAILPFAAPISWTILAGADGLRRIYVRAVDVAGATSRVLRVTTRLDRTRPTVASAFIVWSGTRHQGHLYVHGHDTGSGVAGTEVLIRHVGTSPWTVVARRTTAAWIWLPRVRLPYQVRIRVFDRAGNVSRARYLTVW